MALGSPGILTAPVPGSDLDILAGPIFSIVDKAIYNTNIGTILHLIVIQRRNCHWSHLFSFPSVQISTFLLILTFHQTSQNDGIEKKYAYPAGI